MQSESLNSRGSVASRVLYFVACQCLPEQCGVDAVITLDIFQTSLMYIRWQRWFIEMGQIFDRVCPTAGALLANTLLLFPS